MCVWGPSFQWFMGIIGGSTRANRPIITGLLGALLMELLRRKKHGWALIRAWALNKDNTVLLL